MKAPDIGYVAIYPPIGISRIGNSPEHFLAADQPGVSVVPDGGFKDLKGRIKKEVACFRVYAFDSDGNVLKELTANNATVDWRAEVANVKPAWYNFENAMDLGPQYSKCAAPRNGGVFGVDRKQLAITPSPKSISGRDVQDNKHNFDDGLFYGTPVKLGHLQTDSEGRLLFFAGNGDAQSHKDVPITTFANNDGWHDDTCDGTIRATVTVNGTCYEATPASIAVTPPNFGQGLYGVVTMNDVVQNLFITEMGYPNPSAEGVEFYRDIYPMLERMSQTQWVNQGFNMLFGHNSPSDFSNPAIIKVLEDPNDGSKSARERVFEWFRDPNSKEWAPAKVPPFYGDGFGDYTGIYLDDLPITVTQYERLTQWMQGNFTTGAPKRVKPFEELSVAEQIDSLNQAPLEDCLGGPFHPGIELTWTMRIIHMWKEPYRLNVLPEGEHIQLDYGPCLTPEVATSADGPFAANGPGSLTRWMGVPWQTDEASCLSGYTVSAYLPLPSFWAARVPNQVLAEDGYLRMQAGNVGVGQRLKHLDYRQDWLRDIEADHLQRLTNMVNEWHELGIITKQEKPMPNNSEGYLPKVAWVEMGRNFHEEDPDATFAQVLYAEGDEASVVDADLKEDVGATFMVTSLEHAQKKVAELRADAPKSTRKRKTLGRGER